MVFVRRFRPSLLTLVILAGVLLPGAAPAAAAPDALQARVVAELRSFTSWLRAGPGPPAQGVIGEVGWPGDVAASGDERWNTVARTWYEAASAAGLWVAAWSAGELWSGSYKLLVYGPGPRTHPQAAVVEAQAGARQRGVNVAGAEFGTPVDEETSSFSNASPGRYGPDYAYPSAAYLSGLASRGMTFVRLPVRWERLQPRLGGELDSAELERLERTLADAGRAGLQVIVDVHNYGAYYLSDPATGRGVRRPIGSPAVPIEAFADLWRRLSERLRDEGAILAYGLMNEPVGLEATTWERASRAAARAIRAAGDRTPILVQSNHWGGVRQFGWQHPRGPWIEEPNVWYEAHHYFDSDRSARYLESYDRELGLARRR